jgi:hypothetical protein
METLSEAIRNTISLSIWKPNGCPYKR